LGLGLVFGLASGIKLGLGFKVRAGVRVRIRVKVRFKVCSGVRVRVSFMVRFRVGLGQLLGLYLKLLKFGSVAYNHFDVIRFNTVNVVFLRDVKEKRVRVS